MIMYFSVNSCLFKYGQLGGYGFFNYLRGLILIKYIKINVFFGGESVLWIMFMVICLLC